MLHVKMAACRICCVCDHDQVHSSGCGQLSTDLLAHLGFKRIVPCCFRNKRMHLKTCLRYSLQGYLFKQRVLICEQNGWWRHRYSFVGRCLKLKALCHDIRRNCIVMTSLVQKSNQSGYRK